MNFWLGIVLFLPSNSEKHLKIRNLPGGRLGESLIRLGFLGEIELVRFLSEQYGMPSVNLSEIEIPSDVINNIPTDVAIKYQVMPVSLRDTTSNRCHG